MLSRILQLDLVCLQISKIDFFNTSRTTGLLWTTDLIGCTNDWWCTKTLSCTVSELGSFEDWITVYVCVQSVTSFVEFNWFSWRMKGFRLIWLFYKLYEDSRNLSNWIKNFDSKFKFKKNNLLLNLGSFTAETAKTIANKAARTMKNFIFLNFFYCFFYKRKNFLNFFLI